MLAFVTEVGNAEEDLGRSGKNHHALMNPGVIVRNLISAIADKPTGSPAIGF
jgi:hypothetical protein